MNNVQNSKIFSRTVYITSVILLCLIFGFYGVFKAYESIRLIAFGEYRNAVEITDEEIKVFDYEIN